MIVDTSIVLAILFNEAEASKAADLLNAHAGTLAMSVVNVAECLMRIRSQVTPARLEATLQAFEALPIDPVQADSAQARVAAEARLRYPALNFGDCFGYALAMLRGEPILTLDRDFLVTDLVVLGVSRG